MDVYYSTGEVRSILYFLLVDFTATRVKIADNGGVRLSRMKQRLVIGRVIAINQMSLASVSRTASFVYFNSSSHSFFRLPYIYHIYVGYVCIYIYCIYYIYFIGIENETGSA